MYIIIKNTLILFRNQALSASEMVLLTLRFYASGSFLITIGDFAGIHKSTASRIINKVSRAIAQLSPLYIKFPNTEEDIQRLRQKFYNIARFPRCIGALDCTHIKIQSPGGNNSEAYRNRKNFFSINVQTICDPDLKILDIVARWPGSAHDSTIFNNSNIRERFERGELGDNLLVGDSGYPIKSYLITPLLRPVRNEEHLFNESQIRTRNPVERCYGVWKRRFPVLALGIRLNLDRVEAVIVATAVLHNIACERNEEIPPIDTEVEAAIQLINNVPNIINNNENNITINNSTRLTLINEYFSRL